MVGDGLNITLCPEDSVVNTGPSLLDVFTARAPLPVDSIHASVEACELEQEVAGGWVHHGHIEHIRKQKVTQDLIKVPLLLF